MVDTLKLRHGKTFSEHAEATLRALHETRRNLISRAGRALNRDFRAVCRDILRYCRAQIPGKRSLSAKIVLIGLIFVIVPLLIYSRFHEAETGKAELLYQSAREQARLVAQNLSPLLNGNPPSLPQIDNALASLASESLYVRVLFQPTGMTGDRDFYYIAAKPHMTDAYLNSEVEKFREIGVLARLAASCGENVTIGIRHAMPGGPQQLVTAIYPVSTRAGCWSIVTSFAGESVLESSFGQPYWQSPEMQFASLLYFSAAFVTLFILFRFRSSLRSLRDTAAATGRSGIGGSFSAGNSNPDVANLAREFDRMVQRIGLLSFALERSPIAVTVTDSNWRIAYVNPAYEAFAGRDRNELLGLDLRAKEFESMSDLSWAAICDKVSEGETWHGRIRRAKPDGRILWAEVSLYRLASDTSGSDHFVCLQEDVTERQQMLNGLVEEKERALTLNRVKTNFFARMSHEFRTPLNAILGFSEVIAGETFGPCGNGKYVEYAGHIHNSGQHLLSLINDILDLSKIESGKQELALEPVNLSRLTESAVALIAPQSGKAGIRLGIEDNLNGRPVIADERALKQILLNLLSNGVKFTPSGGSVTVTLAGRDEGSVDISVADTGCGIAADDIPKVCEPYERADTFEVRNTGGTGLGLPIVKRLVELQNGRFCIASSVGSGTTVTVTLPVAT